MVSNQSIRLLFDGVYAERVTPFISTGAFLNYRDFLIIILLMNINQKQTFYRILSQVFPDWMERNDELSNKRPEML